MNAIAGLRAWKNLMNYEYTSLPQSSVHELLLGGNL
jgi:hypothetical protein